MNETPNLAISTRLWCTVPDPIKNRVAARALIELADEIDLKARNAHANARTMRAVAESSSRLGQKVAGYKKRISEMIEEVGMEEEQRDIVLTIHRHIYKVIDDHRVGHLKQALDEAPFGRGLAAAAVLLRKRAAVELSIAQRVEDEIAVEDAETITDEIVDDIAACAHCGDAILIATGSGTCSACISHKNRNGKLPSKRTIQRRRNRNADA